MSVWAVSWLGGRLDMGFLEGFQAPKDGRVHLLLAHGTATGVGRNVLVFPEIAAHRDQIDVVFTRRSETSSQSDPEFVAPSAAHVGRQADLRPI